MARRGKCDICKLQVYYLDPLPLKVRRCPKCYGPMKRTRKTCPYPEVETITRKEDTR